MTIEVTAELNRAIEHFNRGEFEQAADLCDRILGADPDNLRALNVLGGSLARTGDLQRAVRTAEKVCALAPGNAVFLGNLSYLYSMAGDFQRAVLAMAHAVLAEPDNSVHQGKFARLVNRMEFYRLAPETADIGKAIALCLGNRAIDPMSFAVAWQSLVLLDPAFVELAALAEGGAFEAQAQNVDIERLAGPLTDTFVLRGLRSLRTVGPGLEGVMTFLRRWFLLRRDDYDAEAFLPFLCALAEHCLLNEYVYGWTEDERRAIDALQERLERSSESGARAGADFALVHCYRDPEEMEHLRPPGQSVASTPDDPLARLVENTVSFGEITRRHGGHIAALSSPGAAMSRVSSEVAAQYEENPYPRWRHLDIPSLPPELQAKARGRDILVAGCGTGYEPLNLAVHYPQARILAVDISLPSLAWGRHKAVEFGIDNVEFMQADILELDTLGRQFDLVSSVGVLHHMKDPVQGWRKLLACLAPDGFMKIGLYSEAARKPVALCRQWIEGKGFEPTPDGIRAFRQAIMDLDADDPLRDIMGWTDFYTLSMCRDLAFHVQEHTVTLPWIRAALDELGLAFLSMRIGNPVFRQEYRSMFPNDRNLADLDRLHEYEQHNPDTFRDMYQFWCCRRESATAKRPPAWFYTLGL